jgi:hypothetical protein
MESKNMKISFGFLAAAVVSMSLVGCGGSDTTLVGHSPRVRAFNAIYGMDPTKVQFKDSGVDNQELAYGNVTQYAILDNTNENVRFTNPANGDLLASAPETLFRNNTFYTVVGLGGSGSDTTLVLEDRQNNPSGSDANFRVVNAIKDAGVDNIDVWVVPAGTDISGTTPTFTSVVNETASDYATLTAGQWRIVVKDHGSQRLMDDENVTVTGAEAYSIFIAEKSNTGGAQTAQAYVYAEGND